MEIGGDRARDRRHQGPGGKAGFGGEEAAAGGAVLEAVHSIQRSQPSRPAITLELVTALAPNHTLAEKLCSTFGLDPVDHEGIRGVTKEQIVLSANALQPTVNETAMKIHLQRIVGSEAWGACP